MDRSGVARSAWSRPGAEKRNLPSVISCAVSGIWAASGISYSGKLGEMPMDIGSRDLDIQASQAK